MASSYPIKGKMLHAKSVYLYHCNVHTKISTFAFNLKLQHSVCILTSTCLPPLNCYVLTDTLSIILQLVAGLAETFGCHVIGGRIEDMDTQMAAVLTEARLHRRCKQTHRLQHSYLHLANRHTDCSTAIYTLQTDTQTAAQPSTPCKQTHRLQHSHLHLANRHTDCSTAIYTLQTDTQTAAQPSTPCKQTHTLQHSHLHLANRHTDCSTAIYTLQTDTQTAAQPSTPCKQDTQTAAQPSTPCKQTHRLQHSHLHLANRPWRVKIWWSAGEIQGRETMILNSYGVRAFKCNKNCEWGKHLP